MRRLLLAVCLLCGNEGLRAQDQPAVVLSGESRGAAGRIAGIRQLLDAKKWDAAVAEIQNVIETSGGDELALLVPDRAVQARMVCQQMLATLPAEVRPEVLRLYRGRAEAQARKWLEQGLAERDVRLLRRVVDEASCTRAAERALDALGDLAFERGRFDEAEYWWRTPAPAARRRDLFFPDPETDAARTQAKVLLARLFRDEPHWNDDLAAYRKEHPNASGKLAGREGPYANVLKTVADGLRQTASSAECDWPTFGGDAARGLLLPAAARQTDRLGALCRKPTWRFGLESRTRLDSPQPPPQWDGGDRQSARSLAFHPVLADDKLIVADARRVTAYDLRTGRGEEWYDAARLQPGLNPNLALPAPPDLRYTLTVADDCVLARLGTQEVRDVRDVKKEGEAESQIACFDLEAGPDGRRVRWVARAATRDAGVFEGSPLVQDGQVFVAATRCTADQTITAVYCYALDARGTPPLRWSRDVCETHELQTGDRRWRHHLLTLAGPNVVYCSHSGAIVALDALTGRRAWSVRYPVLAPFVGPELPGIDRLPLRDLTPCLYAAGRLYAAPADSDRLLCLDPATGRTLWERKIAEVVHLLGVGRNRLIFTTGSGLRAVDAATGTDVWTAPDAGEMPPMGRGLLLGDLVLWPTTRGVLLVRQEDGRLAEDPAFLHSVPKGNLAFGHGCLVVADRLTATVFAPPAMHLQERRRDAERDPESAEAALELGIAETDAGHFDAAVKSLESAERLAKWEPMLREEARSARHAAYLAAAWRAEAAGRREDAVSALGQAAGTQFGPVFRVQAQRLLAAQRERCGDHAGAVAAWQALLEDELLRGVRVKGDNELPRTAGQLAGENIETLLKKHGQAVYLAVEKRAKAKFDATPKGKDRAEALERLTVEFPNAVVRRVALRELIELYENARRLCGVLHACDRLRANPGPEDKDEDLVKIIFSASRGMDPFPQGPPNLPLSRSWSLALEPDESIPAGRIGSGVPAGSLVFTALPRHGTDPGGWLRCRSQTEGKIIWQAPLPFLPEWVASHLELILIGGKYGVAAVRFDDGHLAWFFPARASHFNAASNRLVFLEDGRLLAVSLWSGKVIWQREAPGAGFLPTLGRFRENYYAEYDRLLVQTATGRRWLLDAETGRTLDDAPSSAPWPEAPPRWLTLEDRPPVLLGEDGRRVVRIDTKTGREVWSTTVHAPSAIAGEAPRVRASWETILVVTQTNLGPRLQRLDAATGKPVWANMPLLDPETSDIAEWGLDKKIVFVPHGRKITALSLADGKPLWETTLAGPGASWHVSCEGDFLLIHPAKVTEWRFQFRSPLGAVQWGIGFPPEERLGSGCPLVALDPATGKVEQRWSFPAGGARLRWYPADTSLWPVVEVGHRSGDPGMTVISTSGGFVATIGGRAWGLRANN